MIREFKPMLAGTLASDADARFPMLVSPKLDGIRAVNKGALLSRSLKLIPNKIILGLLSAPELHGLDGELTVGPANDPNVMQTTMKIVMSHDKIEPFQFHVFDNWDSEDGFEDRLAQAEDIVLAASRNWLAIATGARLLGMPGWSKECPLVMVPHEIVNNLDELAAAKAKFLLLGYEGMMGRSLDGKYKFGRSTAKEGGLIKFKDFTDGEAIIVDFVEEQANNNAKQTNELGRTKRSSHASGKTGKGTLGAFVCRMMPTGANKPALGKAHPDFNVGTGMSAALRQDVWDKRDFYKGQILKFKHFEHGVVDAPRHPVFLGFRDLRDMS